MKAKVRRAIESLPDPNTLFLENPLKLPDSIIPFTQKTRFLKGKPFSFKQRQYLNQIYNDNSPELYIVKGRQTEISEFLANKIIYNGYKYPGTVGLYLSDTDPHTSIFSNQRMKQKVILDSPIIQKFITPKNKTATKLIFNNGSICYFFASWGSFTQARSIDADFVYLDEIQNADVDSLDVVLESLGHKDINPAFAKQLIGVGTGSYEDTAWFKLWHEGTQNKWDSTSKTWIPQNPKAKISSYHIPQTMVPWISSADIEEKYNKSINKNKFTMESTGWWVKGILKPITESAVRKLFDSTMSFTLPQDVDHSLGPVVIGIDWGGGTRAFTVPFIVQITNMDIPLMNLLYCAKITDKDIEVQADKIIQLIENYKVELGVMDAGGGPRQSQKVENTFPTQIIKREYLRRPQKPWGYDKLDTENTIQLDRTYGIDVVIDLINKPHVIDEDTKIPRIKIPYSEPDRVNWLIQHFTSIISKKITLQSGQEYIKYDKEPTDVHDALMAFDHANIARMLLLRNRENQPSYSVGTMGSQ